MTCKLHVVVGLVVAALAAPASAGHGSIETGAADGDDTGDIDDDESYVVIAAGWATMALAIPAWYYWHTQAQQEVDWTRPSWMDKLTLHSVRFDTN
jgi:hypothetical protein